MTIYPMQGKGPYYTNCYLVVGEQGRAVLVDAEVTPEQVAAQLEKCGAALSAILLTHGHGDHVGNLRPLLQKTGAAVWAADADRAFFRLPVGESYTDGVPVTVADLTFLPVATPGHTPGSTCLVCGGVLFSGDTLFAGSVGRTDLAGGDEATLRLSLRKLSRAVPEDLQVLPGHGEFSTMDEEKRSNPYLRGALD